MGLPWSPRGHVAKRVHSTFSSSLNGSTAISQCKSLASPPPESVSNVASHGAQLGTGASGNALKLSSKYHVPRAVI